MLLLGGLAFPGCAATDKLKGQETGPGDTSFIFLNNPQFQEKCVISILKNSPRYTEQDKINYLLSSIKHSKSIFVRNGTQYKGNEAARWLRWKMYHRQYRSNPIRTARDFVDRVADGSRKTGIPYYLLLPNGRRVRMQQVLNNELRFLEIALQKPAATPFPHRFH